MDSMATAWVVEEGEEWELRNDDGFVYKILKRQRLADPQPPPPDPAAEEKCRRDRKRKILLKLKSQYQKEIDRWEILSNTLRGMEERTNRQLELQKKQQEEAEKTASISESSMMEVQETEDGCRSHIDELLCKAEAQEAMICDFSNLCDIAEAMCSTQQEQIAQSFIDLPVWSSPRELMASLCDE